MSAGVIVSERHNDERGLTLVEMMVALFVVGFVLMAMASTLIGSLRAVQVSERVVDATQFGNEVVEGLLTVPYEQLGLYRSDAVAAFGGETFEGQQLVVFDDHDGTPDPLIPEAQSSPDGSPFEVRTAIVWSSVEHSLGDVEPEAYKRIIVDLQWRVRGELQGTRIEATRSSEPSDRTLTVMVTPDLVPLSGAPEGKNGIGFRIDVFADEPMSGVKAAWLNRSGNEMTDTFGAVAGTDNQHWRLTFNANTRHFANGGTRFEITATAIDGVRTTTTVGRATFLHVLRIVSGSLTVVPAGLQVHPTLGPCSGLEVGVAVDGAVLSDPLTISFGTGAPQPTEAVESLTAGTRYQVAFDPDDLPLEEVVLVDGLWYLPLELEVLRSADARDAQLPVNVQVTYLSEDDTCAP